VSDAISRLAVEIPEAPKLTAVVLARFHGGMTWPEILALTEQRRTKWWRDVVGHAEDDGLLRWCPGRIGQRGRWYLTERGRHFIAEHAVGNA
jgi:hypothetical protein